MSDEKGNGADEGRRASFGGAERIGGYRLIEEVGRGAQGRVYRAHDERLNRHVAVKLAPSRVDMSSTVKRRFELEAEMISKLDHPAICAIYDVGEDEGVSYIAMQFVEGVTIADRLSEARSGRSSNATLAFSHVSFDDDGAVVETPRSSSSTTGSAPTERAQIHAILRFMERVAEALHFAHQGGLIHRDVKPGNIMVQPDDTPKVLDFGLAQDVDGERMTVTGELMGTPAYMSPEQLTRQTIRVDERTDVWSLAVTLYECLTLERPFQGESREQLYQSIIGDEPPPARTLNRAVPRDLDTVLAKAMEKNRDRRYSSAREFAEELRRVRMDEPIHARPLSRPEKLFRWARRYPALASSLAAIVVILVVSGVIVWRKHADVERERLNVEIARDRAMLEQARREFSTLDLGPHFVARWYAEFSGLEERLAHYVELSAHDDDAGLAAIVEDLQRFTGDDGLLGIVTRAMERDVPEASSGAREDWRVVNERLAGNPLYGGLRLAPQSGLLPLGPDPRTSFEEFLVVATHGSTAGAVPRPAGAAIAMTPDRGVVLVLLPGGTFTRGAKKGESGPDTNRWATPRTAPSTLSLSPFFISKYELTQAQFARLTGYMPSFWRTQFASEDERHVLPVESLSWVEAYSTLNAVGLTLPTEAQWEYACKAGSRTVYSFGDDRARAVDFANLADASLYRVGNKPLPADAVQEDDDYPATSPVGEFEPNGFGLHDMHGNVWEWCLDNFAEYSIPTRPGDHLILAVGSQNRIARGGAFDVFPHNARSTARNTQHFLHRGQNLGVRPARAIER